MNWEMSLRWYVRMRYNSMFPQVRSNPYNDYELASPRQPPPRNATDSYYLAAQSPRSKKEFGLFSRRYLPRDNTSIGNRSRVSANVSTSWAGGV